MEHETPSSGDHNTAHNPTQPTVKQLCREASEEEGASSAPAFEDIPEESEDALDWGIFRLFDEGDSMMGRHRHSRRPARTASMDSRSKAGYLRTR